MSVNVYNTARKVNSLEKQVSNLQETVSDIQPVAKKTAMPNPGMGLEPLESMIYRQPVTKATRMSNISPEEEARFRAAGEWGSYVSEILLDEGDRGRDQARQGYDMIYNAVLGGRPVPSLSEVITAIGARPAPEVQPGSLATKKTARPNPGYGLSDIEQQEQQIEGNVDMSRYMRKATKKAPRPVSNSNLNGSSGIMSPSWGNGQVPRPRIMGYETNLHGYNPGPGLITTKSPQIPPLISTPPPVNCDNEVISSLLSLTSPLLSEIGANINNSVIMPLNKLLSTVGERTLSTKLMLVTKATTKATKKATKRATKRATFNNPNVIIDGGGPTLSTKLMPMAGGANLTSQGNKVPVMEGGTQIRRINTRRSTTKSTKKAAKCNQPCAPGYTSQLVSGTCTCMPDPVSSSLSTMEEQVRAIANNVNRQVAALKLGIEMVSKHLPCEESEESGDTEGGSRVKKSKKTRRNRRS